MTPVSGLPEDYPMVTARYEGAGAKHSVVGLATRRNYGRKRGGDIFQVDRRDVEAYPSMFVVLATPTVEPQTLPKLPGDIRAAEPVLRPSVAARVEEEGLTLDAPTPAGSAAKNSFVLDEKPKPKNKGGRPRKVRA